MIIIYKLFFYFQISILGQTGAGKSSLISQFITSEYRNAFADEVEDVENTVSICIGGTECELTFFETDPTLDDSWRQQDVEAYLLVYSIDSKSSFRAVLNVLEDLRQEKRNNPIILAGNKVDLERKRAVAASEVKMVAHQQGVAHFEISVALNHDVDELLVGIVAEIKESIAGAPVVDQENSPVTVSLFSIKLDILFGTLTKLDSQVLDEILKASFQPRSDSIHEPEDFRAAIRRFSQRKKRQMGVAVVETDAGKCTNLSPGGLFAKFRQWRKGTKC